MTIYASRTAESLNSDPEPWMSWGVRYPVKLGAGCHYEPRPEFTPKTTHPANPVLVAYRAYLKTHRIDTYAEYWLFGIDSYGAFGGFNDWDAEGHNFHSLTLATGDQLAHARRVLSRLAVLS